MRFFVLSCMTVLLLGCSNLSPSQLEAKQKLEKHAAEKAYPGGIYHQARLDGIDYRPVLERAINMDQVALIELFGMTFMGEGGETHCSNLLLLMKLWGDRRFSEPLKQQSDETRVRVVQMIHHAWWQPQWGQFSKTFSVSQDKLSRTMRIESEPFGASVTVNGKLIGETPVEVGLSAGDEILIFSDAFKPVSEVVKDVASLPESGRLHYTLKPVPCVFWRHLSGGANSK